MTSHSSSRQGYHDVVLTQPKTDYPQQLMRYLLSERLSAKLPADAVIADIGCGRGDHAQAIAQLGYTAITVDREQGEHIDVVCDFSKEVIPIESNSVDLIFCKSVIEHLYIPEITHMMRQFHRILKPGGQLLVLTPDWIYCAYDFYDGYTHVTPFTPRSLRHCLELNQFTCHNVQSLIQLPIVWRSSCCKLLADITRLIPMPRSCWNKWIRWSKERQVLAIGVKHE